MKRLLAVMVLMVSLAAPSLAQPRLIDNLSTEDAAAIHDAVQSQLEAFSKDDAAGAFELATFEKQILIGSADNFMRLIRENYDPIYRNQVVIFFKPEVVHGSAIQVARVTDSNSRVWVAIFWMQKESDSNWKIDGCHLVETESVSV